MEIKEKIRNHIAEKFFEEDNKHELENSTPLISGGILDSISTNQVVDFLEKEFDVEFQPHEVEEEFLDTIDLMTASVKSKLK